MLKVDLYNEEGQKTGEVKVSEVIFGQKFNKDLVHQYLVRQAANARLGMIAHTKTKGEVSGGGKKPYRQKGTGRARQGSIRNPHWVGGGVAFGPRNNRNFKRMMPKKQRRLALFSALSLKLSEGKILALNFYSEKNIKTKRFVEILHKLPLEKDVLVVLHEKNDVLQKSSRNVSFVKTLLVNYLNVADLQKYDQILFLEGALKKIESIYSSEKTQESEPSEKTPKKTRQTAKAAKEKTA